MEFTLDGTVVGDDRRPPYLERFIHGGIYEARPDVNSVVHSHAEETLPFGITNVPLQPVIHVASVIGPSVPVWDIAENFGDDTNLLVINADQGRDLARRIGQDQVALMRGHGFAAVGAHDHGCGAGVRLSAGECARADRRNAVRPVQAAGAGRDR